jgi:hypothetical protein
MKNNLHKLLIAAFASVLFGVDVVNAQLSFTNSNSIVPFNSRSGCAVSVVDVNGDGLDDIVTLDQSNLMNVMLQRREGGYINQFIVDIGGGNAWAMAMADVDKNGWKDMIADGLNGIRLIKLSESGGIITHTNTLLANSGFFLQNATFADMNNDGWIDLFACDDNNVSKLYLNDGAGNLNPSTLSISQSIPVLLTTAILLIQGTTAVAGLTSTTTAIWIFTSHIAVKVPAVLPT